MKKALVIGNPVSQSLSPTLFKFWFSSFKIDGVYEAQISEEGDLRGLCDAVRTGELCGFNVTSPFKEAMHGLIDTLDPIARKTGAVNMVGRYRGKVVGYNSDVEGFIKNYEWHSPVGFEQIEHALVLGAGGAARAVISALLNKGIGAVSVAARDHTKAEAFVHLFNRCEIKAIAWGNVTKAAKSADLFVNATPLGFDGGPVLDFDTTLLPNRTIVYDLAYGRDKTPLVNAALARGLVAFDGLGMLVFQAIPAFKMWFGPEPEFSDKLVDRLRTAKEGASVV